MTRLLCGAALLLLAMGPPAHAGARTRRRNPPASSAPQSPKAKSAPLASVPVDELLKQARNQYESLDLDAAIEATREVLTRPGLSTEQQMEAYRLEGCALAASDQTVDAERPFRLLLRLKLDAELPRDTSPKIMAVFRKVQGEEKELAMQSRSFERQKLSASVQLLSEPPARGYGGYPVRFDLRLRDPGNVIQAVSVPFRRQGESSFSRVELQRDELGHWRGAIPGEYTTTPSGGALEYVVEVRDADGVLITKGSPQSPLQLSLSAGTVVRERPPPLPRWAFWTSLGATGTAAAAAGGLAFMTHSAQSDYNQYTAGPGPLDAATLQAKSRRGQNLALGTNIALGAAAVGVVTTLVISRLVNWDNVPQD